MRGSHSCRAPISTLGQRLSPCLEVIGVGLGAALLWLTVLDGQRLEAAQILSYLQVPSSGAPSLPQVYNLPGYGNVQVNVNNNIPVTYFDQTNAYNQSAPPYSWGTDTQRFNVLNSTGAPEQYTFDFTFLSGAPNPADLALVVVGLAAGTTATVSQPGNLVSEYTFPASGFYPAGPSSTTNLSGLTFGSNNNGDPLNTGWALYQANGTFTNLSLQVSQINGDGIGFTLGYVPEPSTIVLLSVGALSCSLAAFRKWRHRLAAVGAKLVPRPSAAQEGL